MINREIIELLGALVVVGASYLMANSQVKEKNELMEEKQKLIIEKESLQEMINFDNELMVQKTDIIEFMESKICELDNENCMIKKEMNSMKKRGNRKLLRSDRIRRY